MSPIKMLPPTERIVFWAIVVVVIFAIPVTELMRSQWEDKKFAAMAESQIHLVQEVEKFAEAVSWSTVDQTLNNAIVLAEQSKGFDADTKNRKANMANWQASAAET